MGARAKPSKGCTDGNFLSEWFGHQVWPIVDNSALALADQTEEKCPFLSIAVGKVERCIKTIKGGDKRTSGVCVISSDSNGKRENWLACPHRILDEDFTLFKEAIQRVFEVKDACKIVIFSVEKIRTKACQPDVAAALRDGKRVFVFTATRLGGEVDLPETDNSPGTKVDVSIIEVTACNHKGVPAEFGRFIFFEIQTADFHGSPLHAIKALQTLHGHSRLNNNNFHDHLSNDVEMSGSGVEGPNKSNIFKRTFYQMALKMSIATDPQCAGFVLVIPASVWGSWKKHLGNPVLEPLPGDGKDKAILADSEILSERGTGGKSWIFVFDIEASSLHRPRPLVVKERISVSTTALLEHAFTRAVSNVAANRVLDRFKGAFTARILEPWGRDLKPKKSRKTADESSLPLKEEYISEIVTDSN